MLRLQRNVAGRTPNRHRHFTTRGLHDVD